MSPCRPPQAALHRPVLARRLHEPPPPLRLLQRWQPPVAAVPQAPPAPGRWARWVAALRRLFGR